ncbi:MAG: FtsX-like permease family protein [Sphingobacteriales bacterium]|nr:MAG: FtsX-like permease family protein [Sphingobacteriales bacterium]
MQLAFETALAFRAIRSNGLRSVLTVLIIAIGIMALVGILTAFEILKTNVTESFSSLGANTFQMTPEVVKKKKRGRAATATPEAKPITYEQAITFRKRFSANGQVGISFVAAGAAVAQYNGVKTNPNLSLTGVDDRYFDLSHTRLSAGRSFSAAELSGGRYVCVIGSAVARKLHPQKPAALLEDDLLINNIRYRVIGIADEQGGSLRMNADNLVLIPLENARMLYGNPQTNYTLNVAVKDPAAKSVLSEEAEGLMRQLRGLRLDEASNFSISSNESMMSSLLEVLGYLLGAAVVVAAITLLGSVIGLMNIMLVSVAERTREIGISKALGARAATIRRQFLLESILIGLLGGLLGAVLGVAVGNLLGLAFDSGFIVPWFWMGTGILLCILAGVISGIYPALKASRLNPITALRYE